jgi:hypothetical protein
MPQLSPASGQTAEQVNALIDAAVPYKVYTAQLSVIPTADPTPTILRNTLSDVPVWARVGAGVYTLTLAGEFLEGKTYFDVTNCPPDDATATGFVLTAKRQNDNVAYLYAYKADGSLADIEVSSGLVSFEVRVYP